MRYKLHVADVRPRPSPNPNPTPTPTPTPNPNPNQAYAATELYNRDWRYHKDLKLWFTRASRQGSQEAQKGQYIYFDIQDWKKKVFHGAGGGAAPGGADADADETEDAAAGLLHES